MAGSQTIFKAFLAIWILSLVGCGGSDSNDLIPASANSNENTVESSPPEQAPFDPSAEFANGSRQLQRQEEYLTPEYQQRLLLESNASFLESFTILAADPERQFLTDICWSDGLACAGDIRLYDWQANGYGLVEPVLFTNRTGATISGHVWATQAGPASRPLVVITSGSIQATEQMYWWAAQTLAKAGYVVLTSDVQNQGRSDTFGEGDDAMEGVPPQTQGNTFYDGTVDALDFMLSTPTAPFCPQAARSGTSHCEKQTRRVSEGFNTAYNPFWELVDPERIGLAGHSYGASGVSYVGQQDPRVDAIVGWDNLCEPANCSTGFQLPVPELRTPALGISNDYAGGPLPQPNAFSNASAALSEAGIDSGQVIIRGGTHFEYSYLPFSVFSATKRGIDFSAWYTTAWFDKYVKGDASADQRLLTQRWLHDAIDAELDPGGEGNMFSYSIASRMDIHLANGQRVTCEDMESGCADMVANDGYPGEYSFLEIVTTEDGAN